MIFGEVGGCTQCRCSHRLQLMRSYAQNFMFPDQGAKGQQRHLLEDNKWEVLGFYLPRIHYLKRFFGRIWQLPKHNFFFIAIVSESNLALDGAGSLMNTVSSFCRTSKRQNNHNFGFLTSTPLYIHNFFGSENVIICNFSVLDLFLSPNQTRS